MTIKQPICVWPYAYLKAHLTEPFPAGIVYKPNWIHLSFRDVDRRNDLFPVETDKHLPMYFWDTSPESGGRFREGLYNELLETGQYFDERKAKQIYAFIDRWQASEEEVELHINCEAGISRSGAVATALCDYLGHDFDLFSKTNPGIMPLPYILAVMNRIRWGTTF